MASNFGFDITADKQTSADKAFRTAQKESRNPKKDDPLSGKVPRFSEMPDKPVHVSAKNKPAPKLNAGEQDLLYGKMKDNMSSSSKPMNPDEKLQKARDAELKKLQKLIGIYEAYYSKPALMPYLPKKRMFSRPSVSDVQFALEEVRRVMSTRQAGMLFRDTLPQLIKYLIEMGQMTGILALVDMSELDSGFVEAMMANEGSFETELSELEAEYQHWFASSAEFRFMYKFLLAAKGYVSMKKARGAPMPSGVDLSALDKGKEKVAQ
jgi:hypothetical protein